MMTPKTTASLISMHEFSSMRQSLSLLHDQIQTGRIDAHFIERQIEKMSDLVTRMEAEYRQMSQQHRFEALYNVSRLVGSSLDLQVVLEQVMDAIIQLTGAARGFLMLRNDEGHVEVTVARNYDQKTLSDDKSLFSRTVVNHVLDFDESIVTTNASQDPRFINKESIVGRALRSIMATPLRVRGNVIGVVYVENQAVAELFQKDDLTALETFAGQASIAIDNARLFSATDQELQARVQELSQLRRIDMQLNETLDPQKAMALTLDWVCRVSNAQIGHFGLIDSELQRVSAHHHFGYNTRENEQIFLEEYYPPVLDALKSGESLSVELVDPFLNAPAQALIIPTRRENNVLAIVVLSRTSGEFNENEIDLVERIVARAAVAIENGTLYAKVKAADLAKSEFVGIVAHDLKVPMTSILGYSALTVMDGNLTPDQEHFQERIQATVDRMEMLVSDLDEISRIESGLFFSNPSIIEVDSVVKSVRDSVQTQMNEREHTYIEDVQPSLPSLWVDGFRLVQVLNNLVSNAYKYTPNGGTIQLIIKQNGDRVEFAVQDTGIGLSSASLKMLGKKFWRASDTFTRSQPGTGLGFTITRNLVEQMGGEIDVQSEVGVGSRFTFSVPIATQEGEA